jgi:O-antigen ligase
MGELVKKFKSSLKWIKPEHFLFFYLLFVPFRDFFPRIPIIDVSLLNLIGPLLTLFLLAEIFRKKRKLVNIPQNYFIIGFALAAVISALSAGNKIYSLVYLKCLARNIMLFFIITQIITSKKLLKQAILVLVISGLFASFFGISQYIFQFNLHNGRILGTHNDPNYFAAILVGLMPLSFYFFIEQKKIIFKAVFLSIFFIILLAFGLTQSRGGMIGFAAAFILVFFKQENKLKLLGLFFFFFLLFVLLLPASFWLRTATLVGYHEGKYNQDTMVMRTKYWSGGLRIFRDNPLLGVGPANHYLYMAQYVDIPAKASHNTFIDIAADLGIFGILFFILILIYTFINTRRFKNKLYYNYLEIGLIGLLVAGLFIGVHITPVLTWILMGMCSAKTK